MSHEIGPGEGCIICERVMNGDPVLYAKHDEPIDEQDSGWQFLCGSEDHGEEGSESGHLACVDAIVENDPWLSGFLDQPVGAEIERATFAHVFERIDLPLVTDGEFVCAHCDRTHEGLPMDFSADWPAYHHADNESEWTLCDDGTAVWNSGDDTSYFYRAILQIPVLDGPESFQFGVWVTVSPENFPTVQQLLQEDGAGDEVSPPFFGWLSSHLPGFDETMNLKCHSRFVPGQELPLLELEPTDHPLAVEQRGGITMGRVHELVAEYL